MAWFPTLNLYESDGITLVYAFTKVTFVNDFQDPSEYVEHKSLRGIGSLIIPDSNTQGANGNAPWDLDLTFRLQDVDYENLVAQINTVQTTIEKFTKYILKIDTTQAGGTKDYNVMRLVKIDFPVPTTGKKRVNSQEVKIKLRVNSWQ